MYLRSNDSKHGKSGSPYYIGKGHAKRAFTSANRHTPCPKNIDHIIFVSKGMSEPDAHQLEILLISLHGRIDLRTGCLRNRTAGGEGYRGGMHTEERNRYISEWMKAHPNSGQFKSEPRPERKGIPLPEAQKAKQSAAWTEAKRKAQSEKLKGNIRGKGNSAGLGKKHSEETKLKMRLAHSGRKYSPERIANTVAGRIAGRLRKLSGCTTLS